MSTLNVSNITDGTNTFTPEQGAKATAKAWATIQPNVGIKSSYNISSYTDQGAGFPVFNFATPFPDYEYCAVASCTNAPGVTNDMTAVIDSMSTSSCRVLTLNGGTFRDSGWVYLAVFD